MPRTNGHANFPRRRSAIGISRTTSAPLFLRTTAEKQCGERIITPSISAWPPMYGRATPSGPRTAGWFDIVLSIALLSSAKVVGRRLLQQRRPKRDHLVAAAPA